MNQQIYKACLDGDMKLIQELVSRGVTDFNLIFLHACAKNQHVLVKWLITMGVNDYSIGFKYAFWNDHIDIDINCHIQYPIHRSRIIHCLEQGISRIIFSNVIDINQLWKELDENN